MDYLMIKSAHAGLAYATIFLFVTRGLHRLLSDVTESTIWQRSFNYVSYGVDILLLTLGLYLFTIWSNTDAPLAWLGTKMIFLVLYISIGVFAYRPVLPRHYRWLCFAIAIFCWVMMYKTARLKVPFWQWFG